MRPAGFGRRNGDQEGQQSTHSGHGSLATRVRKAVADLTGSDGQANGRMLEGNRIMDVRVPLRICRRAGRGEMVVEHCALRSIDTRVAGASIGSETVLRQYRLAVGLSTLAVDTTRHKAELSHLQRATPIADAPNN